jgi:hypothetical protein
VPTVPDTTARSSVNDATRHTGAQTFAIPFAIAFAASLKAAITAAADTTGLNEIDTDIPPTAPEEDDASATRSGQPGVVPYCAALVIAAALVSVWAGLCAI